VRAARVTALAMALAATGSGQPQDCRVATTPLSFGSYDMFSPFAVDATGEISVSCPAAGPSGGPRIRLDAGVDSGGSFGPRRMRSASGGAFLAYDLYRDAARTEVWGDGTGRTFVQAGEGRHVVYGRIPTRQSVPPGTYADTVTVTVEW
jgi:spore coat protein U domain-containing protein, fimbrial subunit CupE1/2/3/6